MEPDLTPRPLAGEEGARRVSAGKVRVTVRAVVRARGLRRDATDAEQRLWGLLRSRRLVGAKFRRQHPVGPFIADFACVALRLIVEADGGQHADSGADLRRTAWLSERGWRVIRVWNDELLRNPEGVLRVIERVVLEIEGRAPSPSQR